MSDRYPFCIFHHPTGTTPIPIYVATFRIWRRNAIWNRISPLPINAPICLNTVYYSFAALISTRQSLRSHPRIAEFRHSRSAEQTSSQVPVWNRGHPTLHISQSGDTLDTYKTWQRGKDALNRHSLNCPFLFAILWNTFWFSDLNWSGLPRSVNPVRARTTLWRVPL